MRLTGMAHRIGKWRQLVRDVENGYLYDLASPIILIKNSNSPFLDYKLTKSLGRTADFEQKFSREANYPQLIRIYEEAAGR